MFSLKGKGKLTLPKASNLPVLGDGDYLLLKGTAIIKKK